MHLLHKAIYYYHYYYYYYYYYYNNNNNNINEPTFGWMYNSGFEIEMASGSYSSVSSKSIDSSNTYVLKLTINDFAQMHTKKKHTSRGGSCHLCPQVIIVVIISDYSKPLLGVQVVWAPFLENLPVARNWVSGLRKTGCLSSEKRKMGGGGGGRQNGVKERDLRKTAWLWFWYLDSIIITGNWIEKHFVYLACF